MFHDPEDAQDEPDLVPTEDEEDPEAKQDSAAHPS